MRGQDDTWPQAISRLTPLERERAFVCSFYERGPKYKRSDGELLWLGRRECKAPGKMFWPGILAYLCPEVAASRDPQLLVTPRQRDVAFDREEARRLAFCTSKMSRADRSRTKLVLPSEGGGYFVATADYNAMEEAAIPKRLVGVGPNGIAVSTPEDYLCITIHILKKRPPVEVKGWDRLVEAGFDNPEKNPVISTDSQLDVPELAPGSYRVRVHMRDLRPGSFELPRERHLVEVFPGSSKQTVVYR